MNLITKCKYCIFPPFFPPFHVTFLRDSNDIKIFIVGGTLGEAIIPIFFGLAIDSAGPYTMPILSLTLAIMLCILYGLMHHFAVKMIQAASLRDESIASLTVSLL